MNAGVVGSGTSSQSLFSFCRNLKIGYFSQHHVDQLDLNISAVELLAKKFPGEFLLIREVSFAWRSIDLSMVLGFCPISA